MIPAIGVVGFGRMAQALLQPLLDQQLLDPAAVRAVVGSEQSARQLSERFHLCVSTDPSSAWQQPLVLLAVKPQQLDAVAATAPAGAGQGALLISVLAGVPLARLERCFPGWCCVRAVPNTPCLVRQGLSGLAFGGGLSPEQKALVHELFARVGEVFELPEAQLDAFLALSSSGPAYAALISEALADGAVAAGLPRALAQHLAQRMLAGSMALLQEQQLHPAQLKDMVASPAGTTMAGLRQLERSGLRTALIEAVLAAAERSRQLA
ncbi:MAG: pyrroline-5-carboxylate reductase [Prochlorococcaceae cyanobacterium]